MLIDPQGLLLGERLNACSDAAILHFPRILAASNSYGRIRLSYRWLMEQAYAGFRSKPSTAEVKQWLHEYHDNFLLFVYEGPDGSVWGQWDMPKKCLGTYRLKRDTVESPAPDTASLSSFKRAYIESRRVKYEADKDGISEHFVNLPKCSESFGNVLHGVGVGVGVGVDKKLARTAPTDVRHKRFETAIREWWASVVKVGEQPIWDGSEGKALSELLKALPDMTLERFAICLKHRGNSAVNLTERPRKWLRNITEYELGPLDAYGKPVAKRLSVEATQASRRTPDAQETAIALQRQADERGEALAGWRDLRQRDPNAYAAEAPRWVRDELDEEMGEVA